MTGATTIRPTPKQREASKVAEEKTFTLYGGAIRGGKTYWLLLMIITYCFKYPKSRWLIVRESMPTLKRTTLVSFQRLLDDGFQQYVKEYNQQTMTVTLTTGSQIIFMAESFATDKELDRFKGLEINGAGLEEMNELQKATFNKVIERSGSWTGSKGCPIKILGTCNPSAGWVKTDVYDLWRDGKLKNSWGYVQAKITDNPHIDPEYIKSLKDNMPEHEYDVFVNGNWEVDLKGSLFKRNGFKYFLESELPTTPPDSVLGYADIADEGDDYLCAPFAQIHNNKIYIVETVFTQDTIDTTCPMMAEVILRLKADYTRIEANNQGGGFIRMLRTLVDVDKVLGIKNTSNKHTRILMAYVVITKHFIFKDPSEQSEQYAAMMQQMFEYKKDGTSKHDDAPDAISGLAKFIQVMLPHLFQ